MPSNLHLTRATYPVAYRSRGSSAAIHTGPPSHVSSRESSWPDRIAVSGAPPLHEEVVRPHRTTMERRLPASLHLQFIPDPRRS
jgi:hypothetical protein